MQMMQGKSPQEIMQLANNLAQNMHGMTLDQYRQQIGV
jgi:hypothetical protein